VATIAQHLQGSSNIDKLKAKSPLNSALQANITLVGNNSNMKGCILDLKSKMKELEKCALITKASNKTNKEEVARLEVVLATVERERDNEREVKLWIE